MQEDLDTLEDQITQLRAAARSAMARRDHARVREIRSDLRRAERAWNDLVDSLQPIAESVEPSGLEGALI
jgi:hypothetical protein